MKEFFEAALEKKAKRNRSKWWIQAQAPSMGHLKSNRLGWTKMLSNFSKKLGKKISQKNNSWHYSNKQGKRIWVSLGFLEFNLHHVTINLKADSYINQMRKHNIQHKGGHAIIKIIPSNIVQLTIFQTQFRKQGWRFTNRSSTYSKKPSWSCWITGLEFS